MKILGFGGKKKGEETQISLIFDGSSSSSDPEGDTRLWNRSSQNSEEMGILFPTRIPESGEELGNLGLRAPTFPQMFWEWASTAPGNPGFGFMDSRLGRSLVDSETREEIPGYSRGNWDVAGAAGRGFVPPSASPGPCLCPAPFLIQGFFSFSSLSVISQRKKEKKKRN